MDGRKVEIAQKAAENGRQKELYNTVKQLTRRSNRQTVAVKSNDGKLLKNKEVIYLLDGGNSFKKCSTRTPQSHHQRMNLKS